VPRNLTFIAAVIAAMMVLVNIALNVWTSQSFHHHVMQVSQTHSVMDESARLLLRVVDAETGQRGFVITGDESYLDVYQQGVSRARDRLLGLMIYSRDEPRTKVLVQDLQQILNQKLEELERTVRVRREQGFDSARDAISSNTGKDLMDRIRTNIDAIRYRHDELLIRRRDAMELAYRTTFLSAIATGLSVSVALGLLIWSGQRLFRSQQKQKMQLEAKSDLLQTTLASIGDGVITTDCKGNITDVNEVAEIILGVSKASVLNGSVDDQLRLVNARTREPIVNPCFEAMKSKRRSAFSKEVVLIRPDGREIPVEDSASPIVDAEGSVSGCILILRDVTERRGFEHQLLESENTFRTLFDLAPIGIANAATDGTLIRVNEQFCRIVDMTQEELASRPLSDISHPEDVDHYLALNLAMLHGESDGFTLEQRYQNPHGQVTWVAVTARLLRSADGRPSSIIAAVIDISDRRRAEEMRIRMEAIVNAANDAIISKDIEGTITSWNAAAEMLFGYSEREMKGRSIFSMIPNEGIEEERQMLSKLKQGDSIAPYRTKRRHRDGRLIDVLLSVSALYDADGKPIGVSTIAKDLTSELLAAAELNESEQRFKALADNMSQLAWMADNRGQVYWYNQRWYEYTGTNLEEMKRTGLQQVLHPDHVNRVLRNLEYCWNSGKPWEDTFPIRGKDGAYRWFLSRALPIRDQQDKVSNWFGSNTDITELVEQEESLRRARTAAENANRTRGEFLANMSHEIRTPMTAILGHADILADHLANPDDLQSVETIRRNGKFLLQVINDILDLSKIDSGKLQIERVRVSASDILREIHSLLDVRAAEKGISLDIYFDGKIPRTIETDPVRLRQILVNLIGNAVKFTDEGGVVVTCRHLAHRNALEIEIKDSGIGISATDMKKLFQPFVQADTSSTRAFEGTGLGLAISKRLAQALGGDISVASTPGQGSVFTVLTHVGSIADDEMLAEIEPAILQSHEHMLAGIDGVVLVVDDRRDIRFIAQNFIEKAGGTVVTATNGEEAIARLTGDEAQGSLGVDIVLMDMQMPIMDGYTAARKLRELGFRKPIIALTANAMKEDRQRCLDSGCDDYATKPLEGPALVNLLAMHLLRSREG
jgi:PAS domain S-box-containing protein